MKIRNIVAKYVRYMMTLVSPRLNTEVMFRVNFGRRINMKNPQTLNEKIQWLKFNTYKNSPLIKQCADKFRVREYIKDIGCEELLIELIGAYDEPEEIPWEDLPQKFVVKMNTGCGMNRVVTDKDRIDVEEMKTTLRRWIRSKYYLGYAEMQYKGVKPVVLIEKYLGEGDELPVDYKFYCFNGKPLMVMVCTDRDISENHEGYGAKYFFYDREWKLLPYSHEYYEYPDRKLEKPDGIEEAFQYAELLCRDFPFVRVDLYLIKGKTYFGEFTFTPAGGLDTDLLKSSDELFGTFLELPGRSV